MTEPLSPERLAEIRDRWSLERGYPNLAPPATERLDYKDITELLAEVDRLTRVVDGVRAYIETIETPFDQSEVLDRIYEMVGGLP